MIFGQNTKEYKTIQNTVCNWYNLFYLSFKILIPKYMHITGRIVEAYFRWKITHDYSNAAFYSVSHTIIVY
jgi:hypothetical protein